MCAGIYSWYLRVARIFGADDARVAYSVFFTFFFSPLTSPASHRAEKMKNPMLVLIAPA